MTVTFTDGTDGLFDRLGKIFQLVKDIGTHQADVDTELTDIFNAYLVDLDLIGSLTGQSLNFQIAAASIFPQLFSAAEKTVIDMVNDDNPQGDDSLPTALEELIAQMSTTNDVDGSDVTASRVFSGTGDGDVLFSVNNTENVLLQYARPEDIIVLCTKDAQDVGTAGRETFSVVGEEAIPDTRNPNWPGGSGASSTIRVTDPSEDAQTARGRNILTNSDFETFTVTNTPDNWTIGVGAVGTDILEEGTEVYRGSKALTFVGDGSTLVKISQSFNTSGQTTGRLKADTKYGMFVATHPESGTVAGALRISVQDGADSVIGTPSAAITVDITTGLGAYAVQTLVFNTPKILPTGTKIVVEYTTAQTSTKKTYIDHLCLFQMTQHGGPAGPYINVYNGQTDYIRDDKFTVTVTNDYAGEFQKHLDRAFGLYSLTDSRGKALQIPFQSDGSETIADSLIG